MTLAAQSLECLSGLPAAEHCVRAVATRTAHFYRRRIKTHPRLHVHPRVAPVSGRPFHAQGKWALVTGVVHAGRPVPSLDPPTHLATARALSTLWPAQAHSNLLRVG